jgi:hypothetical protein
MKLERSWIKFLMKSQRISEKELAFQLEISSEYLDLILKGESQENMSGFLLPAFGVILGIDDRIVMKLEKEYLAYKDRLSDLLEDSDSNIYDHIYEIYKRVEDGGKKHISTEHNLEQLYQQIIKSYMELGDIETAEYLAEMCVEEIRRCRAENKRISYPQGLKVLDEFVIFVVVKHRKVLEQRT